MRNHVLLLPKVRSGLLIHLRQLNILNLVLIELVLIVPRPIIVIISIIAIAIIFFFLCFLYLLARRLFVILLLRLLVLFNLLALRHRFPIDNICCLVFHGLCLILLFVIYFVLSSIHNGIAVFVILLGGGNLEWCYS